MNYKITLTEQAEADLRSIFEYIAFKLLSPENAIGQLDRIEESILSLGEDPKKSAGMTENLGKAETQGLFLSITMLCSIFLMKKNL